MCMLVNLFGPKHWEHIAFLLGTDRTGINCRNRWFRWEHEVQQVKVSSFESRKEAKPMNITRQSGRWSSDEDTRLIQGVRAHGHEWTKIATEYVYTRTNHQCARRYQLLLRANVKQDQKIA